MSLEVPKIIVEQLGAFKQMLVHEFDVLAFISVSTE
jgi:hypothetical protein